MSPTSARVGGEALEAGCRAHPGRERLLGGRADHRAVGERVGEGEADLDDVGAACDGGRGEGGRLGAGHQVDDEGLAHAGAHERRPQRRAAASARSLSPRPERQTAMYSASIESTTASACDDSSAGMIPSVRESRWNASSACLVGAGEVLGAARVAQVRVLGADARVVEPGRDRVRVGDLAVVVGEDRRARAVQHAGAPAAERRCARGLDADQPHVRRRR